MHIWLITIGEPLPMDGPNTRLLRTGMLASLLAEQGHELIWWSSTFDHAVKKHRHSCNMEVKLKQNYMIIMLHSCGYPTNVSIRRMVNHYELGKRFTQLARSRRLPDIILCSFPTIELGMAAADLGKRIGVPVVMDVRDRWPDIYLDRLPRIARIPGRIALYRQFACTRRAFIDSTAVVGVSDGYLDWGLAYAGRCRGVHDEVFPLGYSVPDVPDTDVEDAGRWLRRAGVDPSKTICWFNGSFGKTCDLGCVIRAARQLELEGRSELQFVLSGDGECFGKWSALAEGLNNVVFTGWIDTTRIRYMMQIADVGLAAYSENAPQGLPNKIFEYMSAGLPVLSSLKGEAGDMLEREGCGLSYTGGRADGFLDKLLLLSKRADLRADMSWNARRVFTERYCAEKIYTGMSTYLTDLAREHRPGGHNA